MNDQSGASSPSDQVGVIAEQVKQQTGDAVGQAAEQAKSMLDQQKDHGADMLSQTAKSLRQAGTDLRKNNSGAVAQVLDGAAQGADNLAGYLRQHNVVQLVDELEDYARQNSTLFLGGAFALGVIAARFLKSSPPDTQSQTYSQRQRAAYGRYGRPQYGYPQYGYGYGYEDREPGGYESQFAASPYGPSGEFER